MPREAKEHTLQIVISWIDLENAYGSVAHNLIQFALHWFHVPRFFQELIFNYYEKLRAAVKVNGWTTDLFKLDIGLFQGCVLSTILFDIVFQLLLDLLKHLNHLGYKFKVIDVISLLKAYADDLVIITRTAKDNKQVCNLLQKW